MHGLTPLNHIFFEQHTVTVARHLLGHYLLRTIPATRAWVLCRIVETEAYTQNDPACHAYQRNTGRAANLYRSAGHAYVYMIYGMYYCLNVVTEPEGQAGAVMFRALEVVDHSPHWTPAPLNGPGKLCKALHITTAIDNGQSMLDKTSHIQLLAGEMVANPVVTTRIGISQGKALPWRFYDPASTQVSKR
jgi:DNA-3-methyladenine glycosylase